MSSVEEKRLRLEDLWKHIPVFPLGERCSQPHLLSEHNWKFSNLEDAFKEGGVLHGEEKVFLFCYADSPSPLPFDGRRKTCYIPTVVVIVSSFPPLDKIKILKKGGSEEVIDIEKMSMAWVPCIPLGERVSSIETPLPEISILSYVQREASSEYFEFDPSSQCCFPYFHNPYKVGETKQRCVVDIVYPTETGTIVRKFNWKVHGFQGFTNRLIDEEKLSEDHKDAIKKLVKEKVKEGKRANLEAIQKQVKDVEDLRRTNEEAAAAFDKMRFYKFYPVATPDTPDLCGAKFPKIDKHFGKAHQVV